MACDEISYYYFKCFCLSINVLYSEILFLDIDDIDDIMI